MLSSSSSTLNGQSWQRAGRTPRLARVVENQVPLNNEPGCLCKRQHHLATTSPTRRSKQGEHSTLPRTSSKLNLTVLAGRRGDKPPRASCRTHVLQLEHLAAGGTNTSRELSHQVPHNIEPTGVGKRRHHLATRVETRGGARCRGPFPILSWPAGGTTNLNTLSGGSEQLGQIANEDDSKSNTLNGTKHSNTLNLTVGQRRERTARASCQRGRLHIKHIEPDSLGSGRNISWVHVKPDSRPAAEANNSGKLPTRTTPHQTH